MRSVERDREQARQRVADHILRSVPGISLTQALHAMDDAKIRHIPLHAVDRHLSAHPDALRTGEADSPMGLQRLAQALHAAGFTVVKPICCARCGRGDVRLAWLGPQGRICGRCARQIAPKLPCAHCGRVALLEGRRAEGRICGTCTANDPDTFADCGGCGRHARPYRRLADGTALCQRCAPRAQHPCSVCGQTAPAAVHTPTGPICSRCYQPHAQPRRTCSICGRVRIISQRATADHGQLCASCVPDPVDICTACGRVRAGRVRDGAFQCNTCLSLQRPAWPCAFCGQPRPANTQWPIGAVCAPCYRKTLQRPAPCAGCGRLRVLIGRQAVHGGAANLCGPCSGGPDYTCTTCDTPGPAYADGQCARCTLAQRLHAAFADVDGNLRGQYAALVTVLAATDRPESLLGNWLKPTNTGVQLLHRLARDRTPLTHELLDSLPQTPQLLHVRRLLVFAAVLPPRDDEYLDRLGPWLRDQLTGRPAHHVRLVQPYAEWDVLHRARRATRRHRRRVSYGAAIYARARITAALDLLTWLDDQHTSLDRLTQNQLDRWLDEPTNKDKPIRGFLRWAAKARHAPELNVPPRSRGGRNLPVMEEDQRWQQLHRCLHEDTMPLAVRVVGALTLLFGLATNRILQLTVDDVLVTGDSVRLAVGASPIELPPRVADLIHRQLDHATTIDLNAPELIRWLLPGHRGTLPLHPAYISDLLIAAGINAHTGRQAALIHLAAALPPSVLASLLGIHLNTAIAWSHRAQQDWSAYLAARHRERC